MILWKWRSKVMMLLSLSKLISSHGLPLLAILCWLTFALTHHTDFDPDKIPQVAGAVNLLDGRGLVVFSIDEHPIPHLQKHSIIGWPPLFSLVYAGLYALIG